MLALALMTRNGTRASQLLGIRDEVVAIGFDLAVSLRLLTFENEQAKHQAKLIAYEVSKMMFGNGESEDVLDSEFIAGDKFADAATEVW